MVKDVVVVSPHIPHCAIWLISDLWINGYRKEERPRSSGNASLSCDKVSSLRSAQGVWNQTSESKKVLLVDL